MKIIGIIEEDFVNYKKPSMTIEFPICKGFKCDRECGKSVCQNSTLASEPVIDIDTDKLIKRYLDNPITKSIVMQGLEPLDTPEYVIDFINTFRYKYNCNDDIVIYTGYTEDELSNGKVLIPFEFWRNSKVIIKVGRYIPDKEKHYDEILGVELASPNQYAIDFR